MDKNIYKKIFEISESNMKKAGKEFTHTKAAFLAYAELDPHEVDLIELFNISASNREFLEIAYITLFNRPIEQEALKSWERNFSMPPRKFRRLVIQRLVNSEEAVVCHKRIYNDIFSVKKDRNRETLRDKTVKRLMPVYKKLPEAIKAPIRKLAGGN